MLSNSGTENQNPVGSEGRKGKGTQKRRPQRQKVKKATKPQVRSLSMTTELLSKIILKYRPSYSLIEFVKHFDISDRPHISCSYI